MEDAFLTLRSNGIRLNALYTFDLWTFWTKIRKLDRLVWSDIGAKQLNWS